MPTNALILVDLQNDFFPGGALGVPGSEMIFPLANDIQKHFDLIIASKDWHPHNHQSFASNHPGHAVFEVLQLNNHTQVLWPDHCVQNTVGADFYPKLQVDKIQKCILKGTDLNIDSYSVFFDNAHLKQTELSGYLETQGVKTLYMMGLATDYCVKYSVLDGLQLGYDVFVIEDGCFAINQHVSDEKQAFEEMKCAGAHIIHSSVILKENRYV